MSEKEFDPSAVRPIETGKRRVSAVIGTGAAKLQLAQKRRATVWPPPGRPHVGIAPGRWREEGHVDETGCLPEDCPVRPLGYEGEDYYFVDTKGQVFNTGDKQMGVERVQKLFSGHEDFLYWAWPQKEDKKMAIDPAFRAEKVRRDLYAASDKKGPWSMTDQVRGRGAWTTSDGRLILHCGEYLWIDGKLADTGEVDDYFYVRRPAAMLPWHQPVERADNPAVELIGHFRTWNFVRGDTDCLLLLGWIGVALMGAALDWRSSVFIVGSAGTGKSELQRILRAVLGRSMLSTTNATEAGLYQIVGHDSLPIGIDELEGEDGVEQAGKIIKMARDAASGSIRIRGGADHKGVEFQARSTFLFSAINPPGLPPASLTRLAVLQLREFKASEGKVPVIKAADTIGPRLLRRVADGWRDFERIYEQYRAVLRAGGHNARGQNTFGTLLAAAHLLLGDEGMQDCGYPFETLDHWSDVLAPEGMAELENAKPNWWNCVEHLLTARVEAWSRGERHTVGQVLEDLHRKELTVDQATAKLAQAGLGLVSWPQFLQRIQKAEENASKPPKDGERAPPPAPSFLRQARSGYVLAVPNKGMALAQLFRDSEWAGKGANGSWHWALKQLPGVITTTDKTINRVSIGGVQQRCTLLLIGEWDAWVEENG